MRFSVLRLQKQLKQDYWFIKRKTKQILVSKSFESANKMISGIEIMHMIHKGQTEVIGDVFLKYN